MKRSAGLYIKDILEYMERAEQYLESLSYDEFMDDVKTRDAVIRCVEVIGEATKNVPEELRKAYPDIPWRDMSGMRDKTIHGYFQVDLENVWLVVKEEIPKLKPLIKHVLEDLGNELR